MRGFVIRTSSFFRNSGFVLRHSLPLLALLLLTGCGQSAGVIFPPPAKPLAWPAPPEPPRISYVGQLSGSADLKPAVSGLQALGQAMFGKKPTYTMLSPYALCTDGADRLFVTDSNAQVVHVFDLKTRQYQAWRPAAPAPGFSQPVGIAYDPAGRLFVADSVAAVIHLFDAAGKYLGSIGSGLLTRPSGLAFDVATGRLYVVDTGAHQVLILAPDGTLQARFGRRGTALGEFNYPTAVAIDHQGRIYVSDSLNFRVQQFAPTFTPIRQIGRKGDMPGYFAQPRGLAIDRDNHLYVVDPQFEAVQIFDTEGRLLLHFGEEGRNPGEFWLPAGIFMDPHHRLWIADTYNRRVQVFDYRPETQP